MDKVQIIVNKLVQPYKNTGKEIAADFRKKFEIVEKKLLKKIQDN